MFVLSLVGPLPASARALEDDQPQDLAAMAVNVGDLLELGYEGYVTRNSALLHAESFLNEQLALYPDAADTLQELIEDGGYVARYDHYVELRNADDLPDIQVRTSIDQFEDRSGARDWFDWREDGDDDLETDLEIGRRSELSEVTGANDEATWHALDFTFVDGNVVAGIRVAAFSYDDEEPEADEELLIAAAELLAEKIAAVQDEGGHALGNRIVRFENGTAILHEHDDDVLVVDNDAYTTIDQEYLPIYLDAPEHVEAYNAENEEAGILTEYTYQPGIYVEEFDVWQLVSIWAREWEDADLAGDYVADPENAQYDRVEQEELTDLGEWGDQSHVYTNDIKVDGETFTRYEVLVQYGEFTVQVIYGDVTGAGFDAIADYLDAQEDCMAGASCATEIEFPI